VVSTFIIISYNTPWFMIVIVPLGIFYYMVQVCRTVVFSLCSSVVQKFYSHYASLQRFYVTTSRQLKRLESVTRSPIYSHFGETLTGYTTIRAYGMQNKFIKESEARVDNNQLSYFPSIVANRLK